MIRKKIMFSRQRLSNIEAINEATYNLRNNARKQF